MDAVRGELLTALRCLRTAAAVARSHKCYAVASMIEEERRRLWEEYETIINLIEED